MKPVLVLSRIDPTVSCCVDILVLSTGEFAWAMFRRDPEDNHGWRPDGPRHDGISSAEAAWSGALERIPAIAAWA